MRGKKINIKYLVFSLLIVVLLIATFYIKKFLSDSNFESTLFYSISGPAEFDMSIVFDVSKICVPLLIVLTSAFYFAFDKIQFIKKHDWLVMIVLVLTFSTTLLWNIDVFDYLKYEMQTSNIISDNYIDPEETNITFPDKKRNLILIIVESLENSFLTKENGGAWNYSIIPELSNLLKEEDTLTFNSKNIGMHMLHGTSYTSSAIVANNAGIPIKVQGTTSGYGTENFMNGSYTLGDLLYKNGYTNEVVSGATTDFGGLKSFYKNHGNFKVIDLNSLNEYGYTLDKDDYGKWGFNDNYLFEVARDRLDKLSQDDKPFDLQLITIDTHFFNGFVGKYSETKFDKQYENAYATTSRLIYEFINYVKSKPYYKDTTIVVVGDHLTMQTSFINDKMFKDRTIYNCIVNSYNKELSNKDRIYSALDNYPTIVSAIGGQIEGNRLGLGVNLFSSEKTLLERYGISEADEQLKKKSNYYNKKILKVGK